MTVAKMIETIGLDKITHAAVCYAIAMTVGLYSEWHVGLVIALLFGAFKELVDRVQGDGTPSWKDFAADAVGAVLGTVVLVLA